MRQYISPMTASDICAPQSLLMTSSAAPAVTYSVSSGENNHLKGGNTGGLISGAL